LAQLISKRVGSPKGASSIFLVPSMQAVLSAPTAYYCTAKEDNISFSIAGKQDAGLWACKDSFQKIWEGLSDEAVLIFGVGGAAKEIRYVGTIAGKERLTPEQADQWHFKPPGGKPWTLGIKVKNIQEINGAQEAYRQVMDVFREPEDGKIHSCEVAPLSKLSEKRWQKVRTVIEGHGARRDEAPGGGGADQGVKPEEGPISWNCKAKDPATTHKESREVTDMLLAEAADQWQKDMEWGYYANGVLKACADARLVHEDGTCVLVESTCCVDSDAHALGQLIKYRWCERQCGEKSLFLNAERQGKAVLVAAFKQKPPPLTIQMLSESGITVWWPGATETSWLVR